MQLYMWILLVVLIVIICLACTIYFSTRYFFRLTILRKPTATLENNISIDEAKNIALSHSNQQSNPNIIFTSQKLDYDNGQEVYEIKFNDGVNEYDYDISANSGAIVNYSVENLDND